MTPPLYPLNGKRVFVAGHRGMVGSAVARRLAREDCEIVTADRSRLDLRNQDAVREFFREMQPDAVVLAAAKVGGIAANDAYPADFLYDNIIIEANVIEAAFRAECEKLLFLGSSCIYPKFAEQPIHESALLTGALEPTNEAYAIAKIAGLKLCAAYRKQYGVDFISAMPTNLYGPKDNFDPESSHVLPALIRKAHEARAAGDEGLEIWGSGAPRREFLHADDCADALVFLLKNYSDMSHVNVGSGVDITIAEAARIVMNVVGHNGELTFDRTRPDGTPRKLMDNQKLTSLGWRAGISFEDGVRTTYDWFLKNVVS